MRLWAWVLALLAAAAAAAFGWHWLADDPGYLLLRLRGTTLETTLAFALVALAFAFIALALAWRLLRWPVRLWFRRVRRRSRERMANGLIALAEGRYPQAEKELWKATHYAELRAPALLAAARAALGQGAAARADEALKEAAENAPAAALALRARLLREQGRQAESLALLKATAQDRPLVPSAWVEYIEAALATGDVAAARDGLAPLARSQALPADRFEALETRVLGAALGAQASADAADALWAGLSRAQRRNPALLSAYARRVAALGRPLPGMSEVEAGLRRAWDDSLVLTYGALGPVDAAARLRTAESWLAAHPNSSALLTALGSLCAELKLWGKGHEYLERALGIEESAAAWQVRGEVFSGEGDHANAARCYRNALRLARDEASEALPTRGPRRNLDTQALVVEERSEHGVPRLPGA